jgi:GT2 family glycosyltransferase
MTVCCAEECPPRVSVVIPNCNGAAWLPGCLDGLNGQEFRDFEVIVVDNGSTDDSLEVARERRPDVRLTSNRLNLGFARAVNIGIRAARGEYVALLNNDTVARPPWLGALVAALDESGPDVGAVASKMLRMDDPDVVDDAGDALSWTGAAQKMGHGRPAAEFATRREVFAPSGGASLYRRSFLERMGGFDEHFFAYLEDVDLGLRGRLCGYRFVFEPAAEVLHKGYGSSIPRHVYVRLVTQNRLLLFGKSLPLSLLLRNLPKLINGQLYFFVAYRSPLSSLMGYVSFLRLTPHVARERRKLRRHLRLRGGEIQAMLATDLREPAWREVLLRPLRGLFR